LRAGDLDELIDDVRLNPVGRGSDPSFAYSTLARILATRTNTQWLELCTVAGIPATVVADLDDIVDAMPDAIHPRTGTYKQIPPPVRFTATPSSVRRHAPIAGEHNSEILLEVGFSAAEIEEMKQSGALRRASDDVPSR